MLLFDFLLISVVVLTAYLGPMVLRRLGPGQRLYGWMLVGDLALAVVALASRRSEGPNATADLVGTIAIGGAVCLVLVPPLLRSLARRALVGDRLPLARFLVNMREHLQPGMGARQESELISTILEVRSGQVDAAVDRLRERRERIEEPHARRPVDERIVMTYLYARRWADAAMWFEQHIGIDAASPQLAVELVRAYCELGRLDDAAGVVERIEGIQAAEEPIWVLLVSRARLVFLAFVGRVAAVEAILAPGGPLGTMPESVREYWQGMVRLKAGDRSGARSALERAAALSGRDGRARELAESMLGRIDEPGVAGPPEVPGEVAELAERLSRLAEDAPVGAAAQSGPTPVQSRVGAGRARRPRAPRLHGVTWREVPVTSALVALNLLVAALVYAVYRSTADLGALVQSGANVKSAVGAEPWRLVSSMFLHVGLLHLGLNMYGLWILGRLVEQFLGSARMFVVYMAAGVVGSAASVLFGGPATSAGASGAVFGMLGAAAVELAIHRRAYPRHWSGALLGNLLFLAAANVVIGFMYPIIDQSAHMGGLVTGALLGALLSRKIRLAVARPLRGLVAVLAVVLAGSVVYAAVGVATSDYGDTLAEAPRETRIIGGLELEVPAHWEVVSDTDLYDPGLVVIVQLERVAGRDDDAQVASFIEQKRDAEQRQGAQQVGFQSARQVAGTRLALPAPWRSRELEATVGGGVGGTQVYRIAAMARAAPGEVWVGSIYYPASMAAELERTVAEVLGSARPTAKPPAR